MKLYLYGEPGCGKTTLTLAILERLKTLGYEPKTFDFGLFKGLVFSKDFIHRIWVAGVYDGSLFQGTDRLSMGVQPHAIKFFQRTSLLETDAFFIEGDRLFKPTFFKAVHFDEIAVLTATDEMLETRRKERGSNQSETWLRSKKTSIKNIIEDFPTILYPNYSHADKEALVEHFITKLTYNHDH